MVSPVHNLEKWEKRYQCNTLKKGRISMGENGIWGSKWITLHYRHTYYNYKISRISLACMHIQFAWTTTRKRGTTWHLGSYLQLHTTLFRTTRMGENGMHWCTYLMGARHRQRAWWRRRRGEEGLPCRGSGQSSLWCTYLMHIQGYKMWTTWATNFQIRPAEWKNKHQGNF